MSLRCLSSVAIVLYAGCVAAEPSATVVVNHNHSRQMPALKGPHFHSFPKDTMPQTGTWLGLYCGKSDCELKEAAVTVIGGTMANCDDAEAYAETVYASGNPVAVFHGVSLAPGKVTTALLATKVPPASAHFVKLRKLGLWQTQLKGKQMAISWVRLPRPKSPDEIMYRYHLVDGATKQFMFSSFGTKDGPKGGTVTPFVHWAGDLDKDGKLDLLVEIPFGMDDKADTTCQVAYRLYLSSQAAEGEALHKAAQTAGTQPACACRNGQGEP